MVNAFDPRETSAAAAATLCMGCMEPATGDPCPKCGWQRTAAAESVLHLSPGTLLHDCYLVGRVLGQGGFGITYISWDTQLHRRVAVKEYFPQVIASRMPSKSTVTPTSAQMQADFEHGLRSFMSEGRILARFNDHPCIVSVLNLFEANHTGYLVMGYLDGMTLAQSLASAGGRFSYDVAREIMTRVMDGLREVHNHGLLHRDISPDNIYITRHGPIKILDFGAARLEAGERSQSLSVILKEGYAPEEQYRRNGTQGPWTDVYAVAATLYRSITGVTPPPALERLHSDTLKPPRELGVAISEKAEAALLRGLAVRAGDRFQSIESFEEALHGEPADPLPPKPKPDPGPNSTPSGQAKWIWIGLLVLAFVFIGSLIQHQMEQDRIAEARRVEEVRARDEAERRQREAAVAAAAAEAERQRQAEAARQREQQAVAGAEELSDRFDKWLDTRREQMAPNVITVTVTNQCDKGPVRFAMRFKMPDDTDRWMTSGWWSIEPGKSIRPRMATSNRNVYFWGQDSTGTWDGSNEAGSVVAHVVSNNFVHLDGTDIQGRDAKVVSMFVKVFDSWGDHTVQFTCTANR